ncbi:restriction endonuclease [Erwinia persicina]|uniref:restriction endonuclease n=1 Tax=Erwinia persicina TaxID=55211 RepID=UPI0017866C89|nr:restriction endonuclease [Erwinia persicina]MBD8165420.1 restriction endonuclease [Erwinia persicina]
MKFKRQDVLLFDRLFDSAGGYILDFSNRTLAEFFDEELNIDIEDELYKIEGDSNSKAKRVRRLLEKSDQATVLRVLDRLWNYKQQTAPAAAQRDQADYFSLLERIRAANGTEASGIRPVQAYSGVNYIALTAELDAMKSLPPQQRGYRFESWLKELFATFRLKPRDAFRIVGEQIDGSFKMEGDFYLLEAKWQQLPTGARDLRDFEGKIQEKPNWTRGVFISWMGFSEDGLVSFGRGHSTICISGADLYYSLCDRIPFPVMLEAKIRQASETGRLYVPYKELPEFTTHAENTPVQGAGLI